MKPALKRAALLVAGWSFVLLGIVGLFLPILQGFLFLFIGLLILSSEYVWAHRLVERLNARFPAAAHKAREARKRLRDWAQRIRNRWKARASSAGESNIVG